ncbi:MAG: hypothetical protein D6733_02140 [Methanobacteriota archaeon]|nr:MAG: hypothetical protein D6733_02140 [Euryarchaeota archaeon]
MRYAVVLFALLLGTAAVHGALTPPSTGRTGLNYITLSNISHDPAKFYTVIEATVENTGFEKVFIALPEDWEYDPALYSAKGEPIIVSKPDLHRKYGSPNDRNSFINNHFVFWQRGGFAISKGSPIKFIYEDGTFHYGWFVRPNERLVFTIKMSPPTDQTEGVIDPFEIEQNRSDIRVIEWNQEFYAYPETIGSARAVGFMAAPWVVKGATMVEATPGVYVNLSGLRGEYYFELVEPEKNLSSQASSEELTVPAWDEWFSGSGVYALNPVGLASLKEGPPEIPEINKTQEEKKVSEPLFIPVWYIGMDFYSTLGIQTTQGPAVRYRYEWKRDRVIEGVDASLYTKEPATLTELYGSGSTITVEPVSKKTLDLATVPEWYAWFS